MINIRKRLFYYRDTWKRNNEQTVESLLTTNIQKSTKQDYKLLFLHVIIVKKEDEKLEYTVRDNRHTKVDIYSHLFLTIVGQNNKQLQKQSARSTETGR